MQLDDNFFQKEVRSGYEVSEKMKKVWAVELNLLEYFDNLCREHNLRYFVEYGTLLGAVRIRDLSHGMMILMLSCSGMTMRNSK